MIKLIIGDDHSFIREGLKRIVNMETNFQFVAEAENSRMIREAVAKYEFDILILDINFPDANGLDLMKDLLLIYPEIKVIIFSMHPEEIYALRALKSGAFGYLSKETTVEEFIRAINKVYSGKKYLSDSIKDDIIMDIDNYGSKNLHDNLTNRELEVFCNLAKGRTLKEIGELLNISISTVNTYKKRIFEKMNISSNFEILQYAISNKIIQI